jgi:hypothetical protein
MNYSLVFEVAVPTFICLVIGIILTIREFDNVWDHQDKKTKRKR